MESKTLFTAIEFTVVFVWETRHCYCHWLHRDGNKTLLLPLITSWQKQDIVTATDYTVWETRHCYCHWLHRVGNETLLLPLITPWWKQGIVTATDYTVWETRHCYCHWLHRVGNKKLLLPLITPWWKQDIVTATDYTVWETRHCYCHWLDRVGNKTLLLTVDFIVYFYFWKTGHCSLALMSKCLFTVRNRTVFIVVYCNCVILWCTYGEKCNSCHYWFHQVPNREGWRIFCCCCCSSHRAILPCYSPFKNSFLILFCHFAVCVISALSKNTALYPLA